MPISSRAETSQSGDIAAQPRARRRQGGWQATLNWFAAFYGKSVWRRVGLGAAFAIVGFLIRLAADGVLGDRVAYVTFYPTVGIAALAGGIVAGSSAAVVSVALAHVFFISLATVGDWLGLTIFLVNAVGVVAVTEALRRTLIRIDRAESRLADDERLRVAGERLRLAVAAGGIGAWDVDISGAAADASPEMRRIFGLSPEAPVDPGAILCLASPEDRPAVHAAFRAALDPRGDGHYLAEYRIRRADDGRERWISARGRAFFASGVPVRLIGTYRDVTDEKSIEKLLAEKARLAEQFASVAESVPGVICSFRQTADGKRSFPFASRNFVSVYGVSAEEARNDAACVLGRIHPEDWERLDTGVAQSARTLTMWRDEFRYQHPQKGMVWLEGQFTPIKGVGGDIVWHGYVKDVTERKRAEQELRASEVRSRALFESGLIGVIVWNVNGGVTAANDKFLDMLGYDREDLRAGRIDWIEATPYEYRAADAANLEDLLETGVNARPYEKEFFRKNGSRAPVLIASVMLDEARTAGAGFVLDISERRLAEAQMQRLYADRMRVMESMAAGLAHEINQPLTATVAYLKTARRLLDIEPERRRASVTETLDKAAAQITRAGQIVNRLREFIAHGEPDKIPVGLHELIHDAYEATNVGSRTSGMETVLRLDADDDGVFADRVQIEQVLVNLIRNAEDAMRCSQRRELSVSTCSNETEIEVAIADTGVGLSDNVKARLFEPFATTKSGGMGVGLSISRAIIEAHHGRVWAESNPGGGAIFKFTLPLAGSQRAALSGERFSASGVAKQGTETGCGSAA